MDVKRSLRNSVGWLLAMVLFVTGNVKKAKTRSFEENTITALCFHNPKRKLFQNIIAWLRKNGYTFLGTDRLIKIMNGEIPCPRGAVWISLDDGWKDNLVNVIPVALKFEIPVTIFFYTGAVEEGTFWWKKIEQSHDALPFQYQDAETVRRLPEEQRREIIKTLDEKNPGYRREAMTIGEIKGLAGIPQITPGAHTATHPILPNCTTEQIEAELAESKKKIEEWTGRQVTAFAYPNGAFNGRERQFLEKYGYQLAVTTENKMGRADSDRYKFPRNVVMDDGSLAENICHVLGIWEPVVQKLKPGARKMRENWQDA